MNMIHITLHMNMYTRQLLLNRYRLESIETHRSNNVDAMFIQRCVHAEEVLVLYTNCSITEQHAFPHTESRAL